MSEKDAKVWRKISSLFTANEKDITIATTFFNEVVNNKTISFSANELQNFNYATIFYFYFKLAMFSTPGRPFYRKQSTNYLKDRHLFTFNLKKEGGFLSMLKILPLFAGQSIVLQSFTKCDDTGYNDALSHAIIDDNYADTTLLSYGFSLEEQLDLLFEACCRLKIAIGLESNFNVSFYAKVVSVHSDYFQAHNGRIFFKTTDNNALSYLATASSRLLQKYNFDFIYLNASALEKPISLEASQILTANLKNRASLAIVGNKIDSACTDFSMSHADFFPISKMELSDKLFWRYLAKNLNLFTLLDEINSNEANLFYQTSNVCQLAKPNNLDLVHSESTKEYSLLIKKSLNATFICFFSHKKSSSITISLEPYLKKGQIPILQSDFYDTTSYNFRAVEMLSKAELTIASMEKNCVLCYLLN